MSLTQADLVSQLIAAGVVSSQEVEDAIHRLPGDPSSPSATALAKVLVQLKLLTKFQARYALAGKAAELILGNYKIVDVVGEGGMGQVYKAVHTRIARTVAIKVLPEKLTRNEAAIKRFHREVEAAARLSHPHIVAAFDADEDRGRHFLALEYVDGGDLSTLVKRTGPMAVDVAVDCIIQAGRGLAYAHSHGVIHRDIKPANLMLDGKGVVKILDMGLARIESDAIDATRSELTSTGTVMGTIDYMSPEQALNTKHANELSDQYSLGMTLHYLLAGRAAYAGETVMEKLLAHREAALPSLCELRSDVPIALDGVFRRMIAKQPEARFVSVAECLIALEETRAEVHQAAQTLGEVSADDQQLTAFISGLSSGPATIVEPGGRSTNDDSATVIAAGRSDTDLKSPLAATMVSTPAPAASPGSSSSIVTRRRRAWWEQPAAWLWGGGVLLVGTLIWFVSRGGDPEDAVSSPAAPPVVQGPKSTNPPTTGFSRVAGSAADELAWVLQTGGKAFVGPYGGGESVSSVEAWEAAGRKTITGIQLDGRISLSDEDMVRLEAFPNLHTATLANCPISDAGVSRLGRCRGLRKLNLSGTQITDAALTFLDHLQALQELDLSKTRFEGSGLIRLVRMSRLHYLDLSRTDVTDDSLRTLSSLPRLQELRLIGCRNLTDACGAHLARLKLHSLYLDLTGLGDETLKQLAQMETLRYLAVSHMPCSGEGLLAVAGEVPLEILYCPSVEIAPEEAAALRAALPEADIRSTSPIPPPHSDVLARVNVREHAVTGEWRKSKGLWTPPPASEPPLLKLPVIDRAGDYSVLLSLRRVNAERQGGLGVVLPIDDRQVLLVIDDVDPDGWGVELVGGAPRTTNGTLQRTVLSEILSEQPQQVQIRVEREWSGLAWITVSLNSRRVLEADVDMLDVSLPEAVRIPGWDGLAMTSWDEFVLDHIVVKDLPPIAKAEIDAPLVSTSWPDESPIDIVAAELLTSDEWEWSPPENLGLRVNNDVSQDIPSLSPDGLELTIQEWRGGAQAVRYRRDSRMEDWRPPQVIDAVDLNSKELAWPTVSDDGSLLIAATYLPGAGGKQSLVQATRDGSDWVDWRPVFSSESELHQDDLAPALSADGSTLYFASYRPGGLGGADIWRTHRDESAGEWLAPEHMGHVLNSDADDHPLDLSPDGRLLLISSHRSGGAGGVDLWFTVRESETAEWAPLRSLGPTLNTRVDEWSAKLLRDGRTLLFSSNGLSGYGMSDLWLTRRVPKRGTKAAERYARYLADDPGEAESGGN